MSDTPKKWNRLASTPLGDHRIFQLRQDRVVNPRTETEHDVVVLECPDWVNIIALTPEREVVMVEQYRHGSRTVELEIPGGMMDPGDTDPVATALRELREETGYTGEGARLIGQCLANPAIMDNRVHTILVENCQCTHEIQLDAGEDLAPCLIPVGDIPRLVKEGKIRHSTIVAALHYFALEERH